MGNKEVGRYAHTTDLFVFSRMKHTTLYSHRKGISPKKRVFMEDIVRISIAADRMLEHGRTLLPLAKTETEVRDLPSEQTEKRTAYPLY